MRASDPAVWTWTLRLLEDRRRQGLEEAGMDPTSAEIAGVLTTRHGRDVSREQVYRVLDRHARHYGTRLEKLVVLSSPFRPRQIRWRLKPRP